MGSVEKQDLSIVKRAVLLFAAMLSIGMSNPVLAQQSPPWSGFGLEANAWFGKMIKHTANFTGPLPDHSYVFELNLIKKTYGQKDWQQRRNYPQIGLDLLWVNYNMNDVYGQVFGLAPNITLPLLRYRDWELSFRAGMGVGFATRPYERFQNRNIENVALGGHWNNISPFSLDVRRRLDQHWDIQCGLSFVHVSNAAFQQPNLGINMYSAHLGLRYFPVTSEPEKISRHLAPLRNRWMANAHAGIAFVEHSPADGPLFPVYMADIYLSKRYWSKNKIYAGLGYAYDTEVYALLKSIEEHPGNEKKYSWMATVFAGHEFLIGHMGIVFELGAYLKTANNRNDRIYQKVGGNFYFIQKEKGLLKTLYASAYLKTHMFQAQWFALGLGLGI
jgi:hypothetical protein